MQSWRTGYEDEIAAVITDAARRLIARLIDAAWDQSLVRRVSIPGTYLVEEGEDLDEWLRRHAPVSDARFDGEGV